MASALRCTESRVREGDFDQPEPEEPVGAPREDCGALAPRAESGRGVGRLRVGEGERGRHGTESDTGTEERRGGAGGEPEAELDRVRRSARID